MSLRVLEGVRAKTAVDRAIQNRREKLGDRFDGGYTDIPEGPHEYLLTEPDDSEETLKWKLERRYGSDINPKTDGSK